MENTSASRSDATPEHQPEPEHQDLADVTGLPLAELIPADDTVLANSLRRLLAELDDPQEIIAAFGNAVSEPPKG